MELVLRNSTRIIVFHQGKPSAVLHPPLESSEVAEKVQEAMLHNAEVRTYYHPDIDLEIIRTLVPPHYTQPWHTHKEVHEAMLVVDGQVVVLEERDGKIRRARLNEGDLVIVDRGLNVYHTVENPTNKYTTTLTFKFLGSDKKQNESFKSDWFGKDE